MRILSLLGVIGLFLWANVACSPDRGGDDVPDGTPDCAETCNTAWECNGVLGNDLANCLDQCVDEDFGEYRICVNNTSCEEMLDCKYLGPALATTDDTDN